MIILGLLILLIGYLLIKHPIVIVIGWVLFGLGVVLLLLNLTGYGIGVTTY